MFCWSLGWNIFPWSHHGNVMSSSCDDTENFGSLILGQGEKKNQVKCLKKN